MRVAVPVPQPGLPYELRGGLIEKTKNRKRVAVPAKVFGLIVQCE